MEEKDRKRKQRLWNPVRLIFYSVISRKLKEKQLKSGSRGKKRNKLHELVDIQVARRSKCLNAVWRW